MKETFAILAEVLISFFAVIGLAYLINDIMEIVMYRGKHASLPVIVDSACFTGDEAAELCRTYCRLLNLREARRLFGDMVFVYDEDSSKISLETLMMFSRQYPNIAVVNADEISKAVLESSENIIE